MRENRLLSAMASRHGTGMDRLGPPRRISTTEWNKKMLDKKIRKGKNPTLL